MPITEGGRFTPNPRIVSPGVFSRENDVQNVAQGISDIGGVVVAPFAKGAGFSPTLIQSVDDLENQFGVADGTLYGPYTAKQYLQEKGSVTVCRVGALTGYKQKYPWVIWAEKGNWLRNPETMSLNITSSLVSTTGLVFNTVATGSGTSKFTYTGSISFISQSATITVLTGSSYYSGATVSGYLSGVLPFTASLPVSYSLQTSASILASILSSGSLGGVLQNPTFYTTQTPFDTVIFSSGTQVTVSESFGNCNLQQIHLTGSFSGLTGPYNGTFLSGSGTYDACTGQWTIVSSSYKVLAVLADTQMGGINTNLEAPGFLGSVQTMSINPSVANDIGVEFDLALSQSSAGGYGVYHFSLDASNTQYITNVFGNNPVAGNLSKYVSGMKKEAAYLYNIFENDIASIVSDKSHWRVNGTYMPSGSWTGEPLNFTDQWSLNVLNGDSSYALTNATTPWVLSQKISAWNNGTSTRYPLFQIATLADGTYTNTEYKIEISNVKLAGTVAGSDYGSFTLTVRKFSDTDKKVVILEQFNNLNLDPTSANFVARRIGDRYNYITFNGKIIEYGTYDNLSRYIRIIMSPNPYPNTAVPYGFKAYTVPFNGALGYHCNPIAYTKASIYGLFPGKYPSGIDFNGPPSGADSELTNLYPTSSLGEYHYQDNLEYFAPIPSGAGIGLNTDFALDDDLTISNGIGTGSYISGSTAIPSVYTDAVTESTYVKMRKFVFGFQGGFDGQSPAIPLNIGTDISPANTQGLNCTNSTTAGSVAYKQCISALGNADEYDINLIVTPGIIHELHSYVTNLVVEMCENRGDCFYIMDLYLDDLVPSNGQITSVVNLASDFDTSYACSYYPWVKIKDTNTNQLVTVPPSVVMPGVFAANDRVAAEWYAPAGLQRGGITVAKQVTDRTTHAERDVLYEGRINAIAAFPGQGISAWGQKTLQVADSPLNRINVRRLLIEIKKFFASTGKYFVFEQNTASTRNKFLAIVNPYLESVQQRSGLYAFQVVMDDSNNTSDIIDQNILYGKIYLKPTKTSEFLVFDFDITPTGASFPTA